MILVLSGTKDGRKIIELLLKSNYSILATTATEYGGSLIENHPKLSVISKPLNKAEMEALIKNKSIKAIVDATHPYAKEVSKNAMDASIATNIPYIRYERSHSDISEVTRVKDFSEAAKILKEREGNSLLTIGSNNLDKFCEDQDISRLYIRVLPTPTVIEKCKNLGFAPKQIIGIQGPFSKEFNSIVLKEYNIKHMVTKDSGAVGGTKEKLEAAKESGVEVILIERPKIEYGNVFNEIEELVCYVDRLF